MNDTTPQPLPPAAAEEMETARTQDGRTLAELSTDAPLLLVFLRHFG